MAFRWPRLAYFHFTGRNFQPVFGIACLLAWAVPIESLAQSPLLDALKSMAEQVAQDKIKAAPANSPPTQQSTSAPTTTPANARSSTEDWIDYDEISNFENNSPTAIENETAGMRQSAVGNILILHPFHTAPAFIEKTVSVNSANTSLEFSVRGHPLGDFLARVVAVPQTGQQKVLYEKTIVGNRSWYAESINLRRYQGQTVTLRFEVHATGWHFEYAGLDYFYVREGGSRLAIQPERSPINPPPITTPANARSSTEDWIDYDEISNFENNSPTAIENETAGMRQSAVGNILILHPFHTAPAFIEKTVSVNSANTSLEFSVRGHPLGDFLARVVAVPQTGQQKVLYEKTIVGNRGWYAESINLRRYQGQTVTLRFEGHATGWYFEYIGLDYFFIRENGGHVASQKKDGPSVADTSQARGQNSQTWASGSDAASLPDLIPSEVKVNTRAITGGDTISVAWKMVNKGDLETKASVTGLRLRLVGATDASADIALVQKIPTPALAPGKSVDMQLKVTAPAVSGKYQFLVIADNAKESILGQKDTKNDYAMSDAVSINCKAYISLDQPLVGDMEIVDGGGFADPRYSEGKKLLDKREHLGTDYRAKGGTCVYAMKSGAVDINTTGDKDPMQAVLKVKEEDKSLTIYGHIRSSLNRGRVTKGMLLGTVRPSEPAYNFGSHLHYGEWRLPADESLKLLGKDYDTACIHTPKEWGWGRAPYLTKKEQMLKCGWIDTAAEYSWGHPLADPGQ